MRKHDKSCACSICQDSARQSAVAALRAEVEWLRECEEIKLVEFLSRSDVMVLEDGGKITVCDRFWKFEGRADNVISAARAAMLAERKTK